MAKNYVQDGHVLSLVAPAGGVSSGSPVKVGALMVVALTAASEGELFTGRSCGVWKLPCTAGLTAGAMVKWDATNSVLVADATKDADDFGKLTTDEASGYAEALLVQ